MDIKVGQVYRHNRQRKETMVVLEKDDLLRGGWKVRWSDGKSGLALRHLFEKFYSLDDGWVVGEVLRKYCENGE